MWDVIATIIITEGEIFLTSHYDRFFCTSGSSSGVAQNASDMVHRIAIGVWGQHLIEYESPHFQFTLGQILYQFQASHHLASLWMISLSMPPHFSGHPREEERAGPNRSRGIDIRVESDKELPSLWTQPKSKEPSGLFGKPSGKSSIMRWELKETPWSGQVWPQAKSNCPCLPPLFSLPLYLKAITQVPNDYMTLQLTHGMSYLNNH